MTALQHLLHTISDIKKKGNKISENEILKLLEATKSITKHKKKICTLISFYTTLNTKTNTLSNTLSRRELQVLKYIGTGMRSKDIATKLNLSISTIETHRKNIIKKLKLVGKNKLIAYAFLYNLQYKQ